MLPLEHFRTIYYVHVREGRFVYLQNLQVQDKTIWLKTSEAGLVEAGSYSWRHETKQLAIELLCFLRFGNK